MDESTNAAQGGTVDTTGSQTATATGVIDAGADGGSATPEPEVEFGGRKVKVSEVENALKVAERFTQTAQDQSRREQALAEAELRNKPLENAARLLSNPEVLARISEVAPEFAEALPPREAMALQQTLAENVVLKFEKFAGKGDFTQEELDGIRAETLRLAAEGDLKNALDFDNIGFRLYKDSLLIRAQERAVAKAKEDETRARNASVLGAGTAQIPTDADAKNLRGANLMSLGHARAAKK